MRRRVQLPAGHHGAWWQERAVRRLRLGHPQDDVVEAPVLHAQVLTMQTSHSFMQACSWAAGKPEKFHPCIYHQGNKTFRKDTCLMFPSVLYGIFLVVQFVVREFFSQKNGVLDCAKNIIYVALLCYISL